MDFSNLTNPEAWLRLVPLLAAGGLLYFAALVLFTLRGLRRPRRRSYAYALARSIPANPGEITPDPPRSVTWTFTALGTSSEVWDITGDDARGPTIILTHGWGASKIDMLPRYAALRRHAARVLLWDMPGHGETPGACTLGAAEPPLLAELVRIAGSSDDSESRPIVLYGYSLGAEVTLSALELIDKFPAGVILEAPYRRGITPAHAVLEQSEFPHRLTLPAALAVNAVLNRKSPFDRWADGAEQARVLAGSDGGKATPTLVIHGERDVISPPGDGRAIADAAGGAYVSIPEGGHKDLFPPALTGSEQRPEIADAFDRFFATMRG